MFFSNELGDVRRKRFGTKRREHFFRAHVDEWTSAFIKKKTPQRTKHVVHMLCERTVINIGLVAWNRVLAQTAAT